MHALDSGNCLQRSTASTAQPCTFTWHTSYEKIPSGQTPESASPTYLVMVYAPMEKPTRYTGACGYCCLICRTAAYTSAVKAMCIGLAFVSGVPPQPLQNPMCKLTLHRMHVGLSLSQLAKQIHCRQQLLLICYAMLCSHV